MSRQQGSEVEADVAPVVVLRPDRDLFARGLTAILALTTPVFAVLYWLTIPDGDWTFVLGAHVLVVLATIVGVYRFFSATVTLRADGVRERGFFGRTRLVRPLDVRSILMLRLYDGSTLDTLPQLFVADHDGQVLLRMRGQFWSAEDMERVAEELDRPVTRPEDFMTMAQLRRISPELLYWFERLPRFR
ncbi:hypothetical protein ACPPVW_10680 [Leifsonia sp. McL0607]|uniref:hypothetical protein n=1 Tax=Leifsonia sp. McL0607 TaxID=3415672 RepID=UPI003CF56FD1